MNNKKICFILCGNDDQYEKQCVRFLDRLRVPEGFELECRIIHGAASMASGYNEAMRSTDAKYKIYMHQDVFVVYKDILNELLVLFQNPKTGMVGMVGSPILPSNGVMWDGDRVGLWYESTISKTQMYGLTGYGSFMYIPVQAIDGLFMATQYDLPWREDLFKGWDFYDISQSMEFQRAGYQVVVPYMEQPWCLHDDGYINLENYFQWQRVFLEEYEEQLI